MDQNFELKRSMALVAFLTFPSGRGLSALCDERSDATEGRVRRGAKQRIRGVDLSHREALGGERSELPGAMNIVLPFDLLQFPPLIALGSSLRSLP